MLSWFRQCKDISELKTQVNSLQKRISPLDIGLKNAYDRIIVLEDVVSQQNRRIKELEDWLSEAKNIWNDNGKTKPKDSG